MGVFTYETEFTSVIPPPRLFKAFVRDADNLIPKIAPQTVKSSEIIEGGGGVGTIKKINLGEGRECSFVKHKIDGIDKDNFVYSYSMIGNVNGTVPPIPSSTGEFPIGPEELLSVTRDHDLPALQQYGGVKGLADLLKTNLEKGIPGDDADLLKRKSAFGSNTYPRKKNKEFLDISLESVARPYYDHFDDSCTGFFGAAIKTDDLKGGMV